jgi:HK97 family phage portal protein
MPIETLGSLLRANGHHDALEQKTVFSTVTADEWYLSNGYYRIAEQRGISRGWNYGSMNESQAMQLSAVFACVKILGEDVGSLPLHTMKRSKDGKSQDKARDHSMYRLWHDAPNPETTAVEFRESMTSTAALCGDSFAKPERIGNRVIALWKVENHEVRVDKDKKKQRVYIYKDGNEPEETLYSDEIFHLRGFGVSGPRGASFLTHARRVLGLAKDQEEYAQAFFSNDRTPGIVLKDPAKRTPEEVKNIRNAYMESVKQHGVTVAHSGMEINAIGSTNTDAQLLEQRNFALLEVCRFFRMPPHKLADLSRANFTNIENENNGYYTNTLRPWLTRWEQAINLRCIPAMERGIYFVEHSIEGFLRGDFKTQTEGFAKLLEKGVYSVNEVRSFIGLNPIEGGDQHLVQLNMTNLEDVASEVDEADDSNTNQPPPEASPKTGLRRVKGFVQ